MKSFDSNAKFYVMIMKMKIVIDKLSVSLIGTSFMYRIFPPAHGLVYTQVAAD